MLQMALVSAFGDLQDSYHMNFGCTGCAGACTDECSGICADACLDACTGDCTGSGTVAGVGACTDAE